MAHYDVYCDMSVSRGEGDHPFVVVGAVACSSEERARVAARLRDLKERFGLPRDFEVKWSKVSPSMEAFYVAVVDEFLAEEALQFRAVVIPEGARRSRSPMSWPIEAMQALLVSWDNSDRLRVFLDKKDTRGGATVSHLGRAFAQEAMEVSQVQVVEANHVDLLQLTDLLVGAVSFAHRGMVGSTVKRAVAENIQHWRGHTHSSGDNNGEEKFVLMYGDTRGMPQWRDSA